MHICIHSFILDISTEPIRVHCCSNSRGAHPTTAFILITTSERLVQCPYVAARVGLEPAPFRTQGTEPSSETPRSTCMYVHCKRVCRYAYIYIYLYIYIYKKTHIHINTHTCLPSRYLCVCIQTHFRVYIRF